MLSSKTNSYQVKPSKSNPISICIWGVRLFLRKDKIISSLSTSLSIYNHQKWSCRLFHRDLLIAESLCSMGSSPNLADEMGGFAM